MAARNRQFPVSRPYVIAPAKHFNARGTVDAPVFTLVRPMAGDGIRLTVRAHCLGGRCIIQHRDHLRGKVGRIF